jgi:nucleoid-associated protein YgaU
MDRDHRSPARQLTLLVAGHALAFGVLGLAAVRPPVAGAPWLRGFPQWVAAAPPLDPVVVLAHRIALVTAAWLLTGAVLHAAATAARWPGLARVTGRATLPGVRHAVAAFALGAGVLGAGVTTGVLAPGAASAAYAASDRPPVRDGRAAPVPTTVPVTLAVSTPSPTTTAAVTMVIVQPGDSLWSIAERVAVAEGGTDVASRWTAICVANAGRLRSGNPALISPGEEIVIPA